MRIELTKKEIELLSTTDLDAARVDSRAYYFIEAMRLLLKSNFDTPEYDKILNEMGDSADVWITYLNIMGDEEKCIIKT